MLKRATIALLLLTLNPCFGITQPRQTDHRKPGPAVTPQDRAVVLKAYMSAYALQFDTRPEYLMAVSHIESRTRTQEFREGLMGRTYFGPCGIHRCFLSRWEIDKTEVNIMVGARALRGIQTMDQLKRRLKRYNASFDSAYWGAICQAVKKYQ